MGSANEQRPIGEHDWHSSDYVDWWITRDVSRDAERRQRLGEMLRHAPVAQDAAVSVLDVGGGYGVVSEEVLATFPNARVTLQDYSEPMLAAARERLAAHSARTNYVLADLTDPKWVDEVLRQTGGSFDLAVSAIVIHNLRDLDAIAAAYAGVAAALKPAGTFLDYDLFFDEIGGLPRHMELMREAGFTQVECLWQQAPRATIKATKA
ncbi:MAG TPA: class I SAM-dependent methyltransferase [Stellaceae bacterium]|nr:class I SAM-dependent methyltransferase [Stellaceae bacterium]